MSTPTSTGSAAAPTPPADGELPPRPLPTLRRGERAAAWLAWVGPARLALTVLAVVVVCGGGWWLVRAPAPATEAELPVVATGSAPPATLPPPTTAATDPTTPSTVIVHVAGAVQAPGVYELPAGARVVGAIDAAGGAGSGAELDGLNLAAPVVDGQRVYVPVVGEIDPAAVTTPAGSGDAVASEPAGPIDLNRASAEQLETLPGVGPATAAAIVDDRERNGPFVAVEDLDRVPGIGPAKLAALRDLVTA